MLESLRAVVELFGRIPLAGRRKFPEDHIMLKSFRAVVETVEREISAASADQYPGLFGRIPLEVFGAVQIDRPEFCPNLLRALPEMPEDQVQIHWTGAAGHTLLRQSVVFMQSLQSAYDELGAKPLTESRVLDFGCGWGRLIRLLLHRVPASRIFGVDPWDRSIELCRRHSVPGQFEISDWLPRTLPFQPIEFDLIYAFSVFTHLSEGAARIAMDSLSKRLAPGGILIVTIRPVEYWNHYDFAHHKMDRDSSRNRLMELHRQQGFAFQAHDLDPVEGEITFGDTSMEVDFLAGMVPGLELHGVDLNNDDPMQLLVIFRKSG